MYCEKCGSELIDGSKYCSNCGAKVSGVYPGGARSTKDTVASAAKYFGQGASKAANSFTRNLTGNENGEPVEIHFRDLFSGIFKKHTEEEKISLFICGTRRTTPEAENISNEWPSPWLFSRIFVYLLISTILLYLLIFKFNVINAVPGYMFVSSALGPVTVMVFFFEVNIPRDIGIVKVMEMFLLGGILSLVATILLGQFIYEDCSLIGSIGIGIAEEVGKAAIVYAYLRRKKGHRYILNGLLIRSAVGAGFAAFESAGYAFTSFIGELNSFSGLFLSEMGDYSSSYSQMQNTIIIRAILSLGGHVIWAAISGAAICASSKGEEPKAESLLSFSFLGAFIIPVMLHAFWDWYFTDVLGDLKYIILIVAAWIVGMIYISRGIREINRISALAGSAPLPDQPKS